ncbi:30S ribosomal protein S2 [Patescibacteria group bacterium]|nr:30S ribosomal protein S2 [Patescibacteria group bacterium]
MKTEKTNDIKIDTAQIEKMFGFGAHYAYTRSKRHSSTKSFIFGSKNNTELFDLEKTYVMLQEAKAFVESLFEKAGTQILFVSSKNESKEIVKKIAESIGAPVVYNRWVGGTLTNFDMTKKRIERFLKLTDEKEKGELLKYTKKERLQIDKEIAKLERKFGGISEMKTLPTALFVVDSKYEAVAVEEAKLKNIPVIALCNSDCNIKEVTYPILANDTAGESIKFFTQEIASVCKNKPVKETKEEVKK